MRQILRQNGLGSINVGVVEDFQVRFHFDYIISIFFAESIQTTCIDDRVKKHQL